jgi:hypothetical protein
MFAKLKHLFRVEQPVAFLNDFLHRDAPGPVPVRHRAVVVTAAVIFVVMVVVTAAVTFVVMVVVAAAVIFVVMIAIAAVSMRIFRAWSAAVGVFMPASAGFFQRASRLQIVFGVDRHIVSPCLFFGKQYNGIMRLSTPPRQKQEKSVIHARGSANAPYVSG